MKVHKMLSLDYELVQRLNQEANASALINSLLMTHYNGLNSEEEILAEVKNKIIKAHEDIGKEKRIAEAVKKRTKEMKKARKKDGIKW